MRGDDLPTVVQIAEQVHPDYPEDAAVFAERQHLYPQGCWVRQHGSLVCGYLISHPAQLGSPPALNSLLHALPISATTYYLHDIALLPIARGTNAASCIMPQLCSQAALEDLDNLSLIAVNQSVHFWQHQHFQTANHLVSASKLQSYDQAACYMVRSLTTARSATCTSNASGQVHVD